jgi:hypothetical protein
MAEELREACEALDALVEHFGGRRRRAASATRENSATIRENGYYRGSAAPGGRAIIAGPWSAFCPRPEECRASGRQWAMRLYLLPNLHRICRCKRRSLTICVGLQMIFAMPMSSPERAYRQMGPLMGKGASTGFMEQNFKVVQVVENDRDETWADTGVR